MHEQTEEMEKKLLSTGKKNEMSAKERKLKKKRTKTTKRGFEVTIIADEVESVIFERKLLDVRDVRRSDEV